MKCGFDTGDKYNHVSFRDIFMKIDQTDLDVIHKRKKEKYF